ncbi:MAG TPA: ABC transporter permease [Nitrospirales bacterium]|nr:ABC transporter permease [Nitrospirales bacterium]HIA13824.1 ABC transporter permease [Nitrospirales bacterium]HIB54000.1 ABC transporter permease [Nitrospirales bacterium]HIC04610.1 ABC transporter permease [Nitrospirales bacterium]HIN33792.1 ABC transporter permease [Nitrospirales bacterium]
MSPHRETIAELPPHETQVQEFWRILKKDRLAIFGMIVLGVLLMLAIAAKVTTEWVVIFDPSTVRLPDKFLPPMSDASTDLIPSEDRPVFGIYLFGTDELGRDVFARMLQGSFVSLSIGFIAVGISVAIGILLGGLSGYYGNVKLGFMTVDTLIMRFTDVMLCFPTFFLILTVVALLPPSIYNIMIVIGVTSWMGTARFVRAEFLSLREQDFVVAAKALGLPERRIIFRHMVPNAMAPVLVSATIGVASAILTESALSFLGFGVQPPFATWGNILSDGKGFIFDAPWLFFIPGFAILIVVLAFNLFGEGLREALNPKLRRR